MGTSGDKIVLLDGMGSGSGSATNGEREDEMYRRGWFGERGIRDEFDGTEPYMRRRRRSRYY